MNLTIPKPKRYNWREDTNPENKSRLSNSSTIPDQTYSIREILNKFTTGQPITGMVQYNDYDGEYENKRSDQPDFEAFMPHPKTLDLVDRQLMAKRAKDELNLINQREKDRMSTIEKQRTNDAKKIEELTQKIQKLEKPQALPAQ